MTDGVNSVTDRVNSVTDRVNSVTDVCSAKIKVIRVYVVDLAEDPRYYCAFNIFQKVVCCLVLYTDEVNLQTFVMI